MAVGDAHVFLDFLTPILTQLFYPKTPTTFLTCFCRGERRKYAGKKARLNRGSNSQPPATRAGPDKTKLMGPFYMMTRQAITNHGNALRPSLSEQSSIIELSGARILYSV